MNSKDIALEIFYAGIESVKPDKLIRNFVSLNDNVVKIGERETSLSGIENLFIIGGGKASALMAKELESIFGERIGGGHIVTKYNHSVPLQYVNITEAGHPVPDENGIRGTKEISSIARNAGENDLVICLISGGGSALLTDIPDGCSLDDIKLLNHLLLKSGADISEMNCIRKHLSGIKGGLLSKASWPARIYSLILSDVIGDPIDVIASGPTAPDPTTISDALHILKKYNLEKIVPISILIALKNRSQETLKPSDEIFQRTTNLLIGTNMLALKSAREKAESFGYETQIITDSIDGDVNDVARFIYEMINSTRQIKAGKKMCLLFGGEPTVEVKGSGLGGRNQHLALLMASYIKNVDGIIFLSGGTDGSDGPTDAAGAVIESSILIKSGNHDLEIGRYLNEYDSYNYFKKNGGLIVTGPTQTNVMDLMVVLIE